MTLRILIQGLFHDIWTRFYTTVTPGIPKGGTTCPQLHLGLATSLGQPLPAPRSNSALECPAEEEPTHGQPCRNLYHRLL